MQKLWVVCLGVALLLSIAACGGSSSGGTNSSNNSGSTGDGGTPSTQVNLTGNWQIEANSTVSSGRTMTIFGWFDQNTNAVTATVHITSNNSCFPGEYVSGIQDVLVAGTLNDKTLTATLSQIDNQVIKITATASTSDALTGSYEITGGCANGDKGTVTGFKIPSLTGRWTGTFTVGGDHANVTADLVQGQPFHGLPTISGTASFSGSTCFTGTGIIRGEPSDLLGGTSLFIRINVPHDNPQQQIQLVGSTDKTGTTIAADVDVNFGTCVNQSGTATLHKQ